MDFMNEGKEQKTAVSISDEETIIQIATTLNFNKYLELKKDKDQLDEFLKSLSEKDLNALRELLLQSLIGYVYEYQRLDTDQEMKCLCDSPLLKHMMNVNSYIYPKGFYPNGFDSGVSDEGSSNV